MFRKWWLIQHISWEDGMWVPSRVPTLFGMPMCTRFYRAWGPFKDQCDAIQALYEENKKEIEMSGQVPPYPRPTEQLTPELRLRQALDEVERALNDMSGEIDVCLTAVRPTIYKMDSEAGVPLKWKVEAQIQRLQRI